MKQSLIIFLFFLGHFTAESQETNNSIYFPKEQLIHKKCEKSENPNNCLYDLIKEDTEKIIQNAINKVKKDTLKVTIRFNVNKNGKIKSNPYLVNINDKALSKLKREQLEKQINSLKKFEVINKKSDEYSTVHSFKYTYKIDKSSKEYKLISLSTKEEDIYEGGIIEEVPVFPGCSENLSIENSKKCINMGIQNHIVNNFQYPDEAIKARIEEKINITFIINKEGKITNIKAKGKNAILKIEAIRIISLLPKMKPGLINGKPTDVPFSIPINFKLN